MQGCAAATSLEYQTMDNKKKHRRLRNVTPNLSNGDAMTWFTSRREFKLESWFVVGLNIFMVFQRLLGPVCSASSWAPGALFWRAFSFSWSVVIRQTNRRWTAEWWHRPFRSVAVGSRLLPQRPICAYPWCRCSWRCFRSSFSTGGASFWVAWAARPAGERAGRAAPNLHRSLLSSLQSELKHLALQFIWKLDTKTCLLLSFWAISSGVIGGQWWWDFWPPAWGNAGSSGKPDWNWTDP